MVNGIMTILFFAAVIGFVCWRKKQKSKPRDPDASTGHGTPGGGGGPAKK